MGTLWESGGTLVANDLGEALLESPDCPCGSFASCALCTGGAPAQFLVEIEGADAGCTDIAGPFTADFEAGSDVVCEWFYRPAGLPFIQVLVDNTGQVVVTGEFGPYFRLLGADLDCLQYDRLEIPYLWGRLECDDSGATAYLTALGSMRLMQRCIAQGNVFQ